MLAHNQIKSVPLRVFEHITLLNSLELEGNHIHHIHSEAFTGLEGNYYLIKLIKKKKHPGYLIVKIF